MNMLLLIRRAALLAVAIILAALGAERGTFKAGAARVDITPPQGTSLPMVGFSQRETGFQGIHDKLFARAIVVSDDSVQSAIIGLDLIEIPEFFWMRASQRIARETGIPVENQFLAAVHTHSAPVLTGTDANAPDKWKAYTTQVEQACVQAVQIAKARLQPARIGAGAGKAWLNVNRREFTPGGDWWVGYNPDGPSDKTVAVVKVEALSGKPIALLINYSVHGVILGPENLQIAGDPPGATSRFVERYFSGDAGYAPRFDSGHQLKARPKDAAEADFVALWTSGAAGDQNPVTLAAKPDFALAEAFGRILGEEAARVSSGIRTSPDAMIRCAQRVISCPGRQLEPGPLRRKEYRFTDGAPVEIRVTTMRINDIALVGVSGEVFTPVSLHLKAASPFNHTIMVTNTNGYMGYVLDEASYLQFGYEITRTNLKPGCAESKLINGALAMLEPR